MTPDELGAALSDPDAWVLLALAAIVCVVGAWTYLMQSADDGEL